MAINNNAEDSLMVKNTLSRIRSTLMSMLNRAAGAASGSALYGLMVKNPAYFPEETQVVRKLTPKTVDPMFYWGLGGTVVLVLVIAVVRYLLRQRSH